MAKNKKVLIVTYYWPSSGGSGVQRYLYFAKYLKEFGWDPVIYTVTEDKYSIIDTALSSEVNDDTVVLRKGFWDPSSLFNKLTKRKNKVIDDSVFVENKSFLKNVLIWVRGNLFIPDAKRFWIKPSVRFLNDYLKSNHIDAIISTSPPQSCHLIAQQVSKKNSIPWVADFRDPWTGIGYFKNLKLSKLALRRHKSLEYKVLSQATEVVTVTKTWKKDLSEIGKREVKVVHNGFSSKPVTAAAIERNNFVWSYVGSLTASREPKYLWLALDEKFKADKDFSDKFEFNFVGNISNQIKSNLKAYSFYEKVNFIDQIPKHELDQHYVNSDVLLLIGIPDIPGVLPAKVFEYLQFKKQILNVSAKHSETEMLLDKVNGGLSANFDDEDLVKKHVETLFNWHKVNKQVDSKSIEDFSRKALTKKLSIVLNQLK